MSDEKKTGAQRSPDPQHTPKKKRAAPKKKWVTNFPCGHRKRMPACESCLTLRRPASLPVDVRFWEKVDKLAAFVAERRSSNASTACPTCGGRDGRK